LPELIRIVREAGVVSYLSSNLNFLPDATAIMAENPDNFRISLSGFSQKVYGYTHRGGDIEIVKKHMVELAAARERTTCTYWPKFISGTTTLSMPARARRMALSGTGKRVLKTRSDTRPPSARTRAVASRAERAATP